MTADPGPMPYTPEDLVHQVRRLQQVDDGASIQDTCFDWALDVAGGDDADDTLVAMYIGFFMTVWEADRRRLEWEHAAG